MALRNLMIIVSLIIATIGCTNSTKNADADNKERYIAVIDSNMTLMEVAKANKIGEPYLRTALGIPKKIGKKYTVATMAKRFKFDLKDLRKVIEDQKNKELGIIDESNKTKTSPKSAKKRNR